MSDSERSRGKAVVWGQLGTYVAGAWLAFQVIEVLMETIGLPLWVPRFALVLLLLGAPVVIATAVLQHRLGRLRGTAAEDPDPENAEAAPAEQGDGAATPALDEPPIPVEGGAHRIFTWRNAALAGLGGFALLGLVTAGWMLMRSAGIGPAGTLVAKGVFEDGQRVVLASFEGDSLLASAATLAFRVDLAQSEVVSTADPAYLASVLTRMQRDPGTRIDLDLAREIAIREGIKAVIAGQITAAGGTYVLFARLIAAEDGTELVAVRETASDSTEVVGAIDKLSKKLRERLGESLRAIRRNAPLAEVTTRSLEALRKYSRAWDAINAGDRNQGRALLREALALDAGFAMAWRKLATVTGGDEAVQAASRAYELRDQLTDRERYHTIGIYHTTATDSVQSAITAYRTLLAAYPDDAIALNNLGVAYGSTGATELAAEMYRRAMVVDPLTARYPQNLIVIEYELGRTDSARAAWRRFEAAMPENESVAEYAFALATAERDYASAQPWLERRLASDIPSTRIGAQLDQAWLTLLEGRLADAERLWAQLSEDDRPAERLERALEWAREIELNVRGDTAAAIARGRAAIETYPPDALPADAWPMDDFLFLFGAAGRPDIAEPHVRRWKERLAAVDSAAAEVMGDAALQYLQAQGLVTQGRVEEAIPMLERVVEVAMRGNSCDTLCATLLLGPAYDRAGRSGDAIAQYERYLAVRNLFGRLDEDAQHLHRVYLRLGQLYDEAGDAEKAKLHYANFVNLWEGADSELQPRVEAARTRLAELLEAPG